MKKNLSALAISFVCCYLAAAQNYNSGLVHVNGAIYDASEANGSTLAANSGLLVGAGGNWLLNNAKLTTPRTGTMQSEMIRFDGGSYTRTTGYVDGYATAENQAAGFVMPIGHSTYMPLAVQSALTSGSFVSAAWYDDQPLASVQITNPNNGNQATYTFLPGYYDIRTANAGISVTPTVPAGAVASTRLTGTVDGVNFVDLGLATATVTLPTGNYQLRFANSNTVLPLTLTAFTAIKEGGTSMLSWKISYERDVQWYTIERSNDGRNFTPVESKPSLGNTDQERTYALIDPNPSKGANYYRLKIIERDGKVSYSATRLLHFDASINLVLYPNPVHDKTFIAGLEAGMQVTLTNLQGQPLRHLKASGNTMELSLKNLPAAIYHIRVQDAQGKVIGNYQVSKQ